MKVILNYLGWPNVITRVLKSVIGKDVSIETESERNLKMLFFLLWRQKK